METLNKTLQVVIKDLFVYTDSFSVFSFFSLFSLFHAAFDDYFAVGKCKLHLLFSTLQIVLQVDPLITQFIFSNSRTR